MEQKCKCRATEVVTGKFHKGLSNKDLRYNRSGSDAKLGHSGRIILADGRFRPRNRLRLGQHLKSEESDVVLGLHVVLALPSLGLQLLKKFVDPQVGVSLNKRGE